MKIRTSITLIVVSLLFTNLCRAEYSEAALSCYQSFSLSDSRRAYADCKKAARRGDSESQFKLATLYARGQGVKRDLKNSIKWLQASAEQGHAGAQHNLGVAYQQGNGVEIDKEEAAKYYRLSGIGGDVKSQRNLAYMYERGDGLDQDYQKSYLWHLRSAEGSLASGRLKVGLMLLKGEGVEEDRARGLVWIEKSAQQGEADAQFVLGLLLIENEPAEALKWYRKAAANNHLLARYNLAVYLSSETSEIQNLEHARQLADDAVKAGHMESVELLASIQRKMKSLTMEVTNESAEVLIVERAADEVAARTAESSEELAEITSQKGKVISDGIGKTSVDEHWLLNVTPRLLTLQLFISSTLSRAEEFIIESGLQDTARLHTTLRNGSVIHIVTYGEFFEHEDVYDALAELPQAIRDLTPIVKKYEDLQREYFVPENGYGN